MSQKLLRQRVDIGSGFKWVSGYTQQELLIAAARVLLDNNIIGNQTAATKTTEPVLFQPYAEKWLRLYKSKKSHTTLGTWKSLLLKHLYPWFGSRNIGEITIDMIQEFMNSKEKYAEKSIHEMRMLLGMILESAKEDGIISSNPARASHLSNPSTKKSVRIPLTRSEALDVIKNLHRLTNARDRVYVALLLYTGMRRSEVLGLRGEDIDLQNMIIHVRRGVTFKGNKPIVDTTKTEAGIRDIPLHPDLVQHLPSDMKPGVFLIGDMENPVSQQMVKNAWKRISKTINVYGKTPHYFRHTFVTFARRAGVEEKTLQTIGGYSDIETMRNVYTHTQNEDLDAARNPLSNMFGENADNSVQQSVQDKEP